MDNEIVRKDEILLSKLRALQKKYELPHSEEPQKKFFCERRHKEVEPHEYCTKCTCGAKAFVYKLLNI